MSTPLFRLAPAFLIAAGLSSAGTLVFSGIDTPLGQGSANSTNGWLQVSQVNQDVYWFGGMSVSVNGYARTVFCIDLFTDIYIGSTNSTDLTAPATPTQEQAAWLLNQFWGQTSAPPIVTVSGSNVQATAAQVGAAMQLALWDVMQNNSATLTTAPSVIGLSVTNASSNPPTTATDPVVAALAQQYVTASIGKVNVNAYVYNNICVSGCGTPGSASQTLIGLAVNDGGPAAPEPGSIWMFATAGVACSIFAARRKRELAQAPVRRSL